MVTNHNVCDSDSTHPHMLNTDTNFKRGQLVSLTLWTIYRQRKGCTTLFTEKWLDPETGYGGRNI